MRLMWSKMYTLTIDIRMRDILVMYHHGNYQLNNNLWSRVVLLVSRVDYD